MRISNAVNIASLRIPWNSRAESSFLVYISDYCTVIKECSGGNICFGTPSTRNTTRGKEITGVCVCYTERRVTVKQISQPGRSALGALLAPRPALQR